MRRTGTRRIRAICSSAQAFAVVALIFTGACSRGRVTSDADRLLLGVAFQPRGFREVPALQYPSRSQVAEDLQLLRQAGFRSLVTYGAADVLGDIPELARNAGFDGMVIMGIWDPFSKTERDNAIAQAIFVSGYCVGNEGLGIRYSPDDLKDRMADLRRKTGKPVTTSEPLSRYIAGPDQTWLVENSDWLFPIAHPYLDIQQGGPAAVDWVVSRCNYLQAASRKRLILKEVGLPTHGAACCTEETQAEFFRLLSRVGIEHFMFEAFDQPFKRGTGVLAEIEQHWGIYRADGSPKKVTRWLVERTRQRD